MPDEIDLGPCCDCGKTGDDVRNVMMLHFEAPVPGTGWGCLQCGLPNNGAVAVLCDECLEKEPLDIKQVCYGCPASGERIPIDEVDRGKTFECNLSRHPEVLALLN